METNEERKIKEKFLKEGIKFFEAANKFLAAMEEQNKEEEEDDLCLHKVGTKGILYDIGNSQCKCEHCGNEFEPIENPSMDSLKELVKSVNDLANSIRVMDFGGLTKEDKKILKDLESFNKIPDIYHRAKASYDKMTRETAPMMSRYNGYNLDISEYMKL